VILVSTSSKNRRTLIWNVPSILPAFPCFVSSSARC
jgi:hypothetical protein